MRGTGTTVRDWTLGLGARVVQDKGVFFKVWAPRADWVSVRLVSGEGTGDTRLEEEGQGYFGGAVEGASKGDRYFYVLDREARYPDPASRFQPEGVHGASQVIDPDAFQWEDDQWKGAALRDFIIYELHVGTFTEAGTFESSIPYLDYLSDLGITAIELMPVAQFPGNRNWGYDGVYPFAPQNTYGGPDGLKRLINAAHKKGVSVILDVVYNHLGPEGNYLNRYGPYFTGRYKTPWGDAINFDGPRSDEVRRFFIDNALYWINEYHVDAIRIDAVHGIFDFSARHFLAELCEAVHGHARTLSREVSVIAESDLNDVRIISPREIGGYGLDAQWNEDFHHALHAVVTGEKKGYYEDFGGMGHLEKAFREGFVYSGQFSKFRKRRHGSSTEDRPAHQFVVFSQTHDQVGNRRESDRLSLTQPLEKLKLIAGTVILSPFIPLLFMGEEYGETAPFYYFISHTDEALAEAVKKGRRDEFASFGWGDDVPDPRAESTFLSSKLRLDRREEGGHGVLLNFYKELLKLRREIPALHVLSKAGMEVKCQEEKKVLSVRRWADGDEVFVLYNIGDEALNAAMVLPAGTWDKLFESSSVRWGGQGDLAEGRIESGNTQMTFSLNPYSFVLYRMTGRGR